MISAKIGNYNQEQTVVLLDCFYAARNALPECPENGNCEDCKNRVICQDLTLVINFLEKKLQEVPKPKNT